MHLPWIATLVTLSLALVPGAPVGAAAVLQFTAPTNGAVISTRVEVPIVLRAVASNDVFLSAEVFANQSKVATLSNCCVTCDCARPVEGQETTLQFPLPWSGATPPPRFGPGWTNVQAGTYRLTARATGENGTIIEAAPVTITVG